MQKVNLRDRYQDPDLERQVLAAFADEPSFYWKLNPPVDHFATYSGDYSDLAHRIEDQAAGADEEAPTAVDRPEAAEDAPTAEDPEKAVRRLQTLFRRRQLAKVQEKLAGEIESGDPADVLRQLEETAASIRSDFDADAAGRLRGSAELAAEVLEDARESREEFVETGEEARGLEIGIEEFDDLVGGLKPGSLNLLAGGPTVGKTTLALQSASEVASSGTPCLFVSFENSPKGLTLKGMSQVGNVDPKNVRRGTVSIDQTEAAAEAWKKKTGRLWIIEGRGDLSPSHIRGKARRAMAMADGAQQCLVIVDYLQIYAKACQNIQGADGTRQRVEIMAGRLKQLAGQLDSPVLTIASQSRSAGYSSGGSASLSSLKESGDLEYGADLALFLTEPDDREADGTASAVDLTVSKNRNGTEGTVPLIFRPERGTLRPEASRQGPTGKRAGRRGDGATTGRDDPRGNGPGRNGGSGDLGL